LQVLRLSATITKVPSIARFTGPGYEGVLHVSEFKNDVAVDDSKFNGPPAAK
jgi:hypothetical protein